MTALMRAVQHGHAETAEALMGHGAKADLSRTEDGVSALSMAVDGRDEACCLVLLSSDIAPHPWNMMPVSGRRERKRTRLTITRCSHCLGFGLVWLAEGTAGAASG